MARRFAGRTQPGIPCPTEHQSRRGDSPADEVSYLMLEDSQLGPKVVR